MHDMAASLTGGQQDARHVQSMSAPDCAVFGGGDDQPLCNLYSVTKGQQAIRELAGAMRDWTGNLPPLYGIFPDYFSPIVRNQPEGRELMMARWGMPSPIFALKGKKSDPGVTNIRNVKSPHWRGWLGIENRCVGALDEFFRERGAAGRLPSAGGSPSTRPGRWPSLPASGHAGPPSGE
jgi:hypothetical protein